MFHVKHYIYDTLSMFLISVSCERVMEIVCLSICDKIDLAIKQFKSRSRDLARNSGQR